MAPGTLRLTIDNVGLDYIVDLPECRGDVLELVTRGDVSKSSFAFATFEDDWRYSDGQPLRTLLSARLIDTAPVTVPAYRDASVGLRSLARHVGAPVEDVIELQTRDELRKLFNRTDVSGSMPKLDSPLEISQRNLSGPEALVKLMHRRYAGGRRPGGRSGIGAYLEIQGKRWPDPTNEGNTTK